MTKRIRGRSDGRIFFWVVEWVFFQGVFEKCGCRTWFFDGGIVVNCVVNVVR
jgi:hypothetical protein